MITGTMLRDALLCAAHHIQNNKSAVDALNVFPVPDGDTGTNMALTMQSCCRAMERLPDGEQVSRVADVAASSLLRGARGNSGVILSLIFKGIAEGLRGCVEASGTSISAALTLGAEQAYKAVMKPTEGTILTVIRIAAEKASLKSGAGADAIDVFAEACTAAEDVLKKTPEMLVELRRAKVVDAGGQGLVFIFTAMLQTFQTGEILPLQDAEDAAPPSPEERPGFSERAALFQTENIKYAYCTELIIQKNKISFLDALLLRAYLETVGDSAVVVEDDEIIKVHVHVNDPGSILTKALEYGELINVKIDNMRQQHKNASWGLGDAIEYPPESENAEQTFDKPFGFVAVCAGEGLEAVFTDLGVDVAVSGGQTMNPSTDDLLQAIRRVNAAHVFVLPNNKNIILAAEQAVPLANRSVTILPTTDIPQGVSALLQFDESATAEENAAAMTDAARRVKSVQITYAARDSYVNGQAVRQGDILGLENGKITLTDTDPHNAAFRCTRRLMGKTASLVTIFYGNGVEESDAARLAERLRAKTAAEITAVYGGQPVYYYIISIE